MTITPVDLALIGWFLGSALFLFVVEILTGVWKVPSISERMRAMNRWGPVFVVWIVFSVGLLFGHFWG